MGRETVGEGWIWDLSVWGDGGRERDSESEGCKRGDCAGQYDGRSGSRGLGVGG